MIIHMDDSIIFEVNEIRYQNGRIFIIYGGNNFKTIGDKLDEAKTESCIRDIYNAVCDGYDKIELTRDVLERLREA